ncbi:MAG: hypothetical protein NTV46_11170 [Verrucomicrobia bacterium]|nr:hypothetical protein [Verrucomicrobiota bacterium]
MKHRELAYCGLFGAAALLLPLLFHLIHLGHMFMPMYLPLVALAFFVRPGMASLTAVTVPLLSGAATGMPPFYPPIAPIMSAELAAMALMIGICRLIFPRAPAWVILIPALVCGRVINAGLMYLVASCMKLPATFVAGISFLSGWPGMILMLVTIPAMVRLSREHLHTTMETQTHDP